jgi:hypothetical protein
MPLSVIRPVLAKQEVRELAKNIPNNVWIQAINFAAGRVSRNDEKIVLPHFVKELLDVRQAYPGFYVPDQTVWFQTPVERRPDGLDWGDFVNAVEAADKLCADYQYLDSTRRHVDQPISTRLFIKELILVEAQASNPKYREITKDDPASPARQDDDFYNGLPCTFATFAGTYQLLGEATDSARNGILPGDTRKAMNLVELQVVRTKHIKRIDTHDHWRAFHRGKDDAIFEDEESIINHPELAKTFLPTCCQAGIVQEMAIEGDWNNLPRFQVENLSLRSLIEEAD